MEGANMSTIDRQRVAAVRLLEAMGYVFRGHEWVGPARATCLISRSMMTEPLQRWSLRHG